MSKASPAITSAYVFFAALLLISWALMVWLPFTVDPATSWGQAMFTTIIMPPAILASAITASLDIKHKLFIKSKLAYLLVAVTVVIQGLSLFAIDNGWFTP